MYIGATVLLPKGFDASPKRRYPAVYIQGHFGLGAPFGFVDPSRTGRTRRRTGRGRGGEPACGIRADERARKRFRVR